MPPGLQSPSSERATSTPWWELGRRRIRRCCSFNRDCRMVCQAPQEVFLLHTDPAISGDLLSGSTHLVVVAGVSERLPGKRTRRYTEPIGANETREAAEKSRTERLSEWAQVERTVRWHRSGGLDGIRMICAPPTPVPPPPCAGHLGSI